MLRKRQKARKITLYEEVISDPFSAVVLLTAILVLHYTDIAVNTMWSSQVPRVTGQAWRVENASRDLVNCTCPFRPIRKVPGVGTEPLMDDGFPPRGLRSGH